jgi:hypothetical protein
VVVDGHGEDLLRLLLPNYIFLQVVKDELRRWYFRVAARCAFGRGGGGAGAVFLIDDLSAEVDTFIADVDSARPGD